MKLLKNLNILIVGFDSISTKKLGEKIASELELFFLDVYDFIVYDLDPNNMKLTCGVEYLIAQENRIVKSVSTYEKTVVNIPYELFINNNNFNYYKNFVKIHILSTKSHIKKKVDSQNPQTFSTSLISSLINYEERVQKLNSICDYTINLSEYSKIQKEIKKIIEEQK
ncbi:MAG: hypothetical protein RR140_03785 [Clostridia bacterium]